MSDDQVSLTIGSKYYILSLGSREEKLETRGTFKGVLSVGTIDAIAIELDDSHGESKGKIRVIPSHVVLAIDIVEQAAKEKEKVEETNLHYT